MLPVALQMLIEKLISRNAHAKAINTERRVNKTSHHDLKVESIKKNHNHLFNTESRPYKQKNQPLHKHRPESGPSRKRTSNPSETNTALNLSAAISRKKIKTHRHQKQTHCECA
jgi:hypothetical protein